MKDKLSLDEWAMKLYLASLFLLDLDGDESPSTSDILGAVEKYLQEETKRQMSDPPDVVFTDEDGHARRLKWNRGDLSVGIYPQYEEC